MKILHINKFQNGGAALCAIRICKALSNEGIESRMLFAEGNSLPEGTTGAIAKTDYIFWNKNIFLRGFKKFIKLFGIWLVDVEKVKYRLKKANHSQLYVHQPLSSFKNIASHPLIEWADIIHLHWVSDFIDYPTFFSAVKKPIVWTLHDMNPAVGIMHYNSIFHPVPDELKSIDISCRKIKRDGVSKALNLNIVAISEMLIDICIHSDVIGGFPVTLIHNGVDTTIFHPMNKEKARKQIGLKSDATIFLFSSLSLDDTNKGMDRALSALERVDLPQKTLICIGGKYENIELINNFPVLFTDIINNPTEIAMYYSAADFFLQCSYEESFGQTVIEAMACGTPVISTPCGVAKDVIKPYNGIICEGYDTKAIAKGIKEALTKQYDPNEIRKYIVDNYDYSIIAKQYISLYKKILEK